MTKFFARWQSGRSVIFRSLSWAEFRKYQVELQYRRPAEVYYDIYRAVVLEGPAARDLTGGIVEFIGRVLTEQNPFNGNLVDVKRAIDLKRAELYSNYLLTARAVIASLFHKDLEEIDTWDAEKFFEYVAMAEFVSGKKLEPATLDQPKPSAKGAPKRPLTERQQRTIERVQERDAPSVSPPSAEDPAPRLPRRALTPAQQIVLDRMRRQ